MATFRLSYNTKGWGDTPDLDGMLATIADAGWEGVEFISVSLDWLGIPSRVRASFDKHGLEPVCMFGRVASLGDDGGRVIEQQKRLMEYAAELGCSVYAFTGPKRVPQRLPTDDEFKRLAH